jgi:hypothetical protein
VTLDEAENVSRHGVRPDSREPKKHDVHGLSYEPIHACLLFIITLVSSKSSSKFLMEENAAHKRGVVSRFIRRVGGTFKTSFAIVGVVAAVAVYSEYKKLRPDDDDKDEKKKVLVIPFHRIHLVDNKKMDLRSEVSSLGTDDNERVFKLEVRELVDLLHEAAADPNIVGLYGIFGHGSQLSGTGWADLEEVRNALR